MFLSKTMRPEAINPSVGAKALMGFILLFVITSLAWADSDKYQEGVHYFLLPESAISTQPGRIEVVDVFQYKCGYCLNFYSYTAKWQKSLADDVDYKRIPATWRKNLLLPAKAYFTAKKFNKLNELHSTLFNAMLIDNKTLNSEEEIFNYFSDVGISKEDFYRIFRSEEIAGNVEETTKRLKSYKEVNATPRLVVNGKYWISGKSAGGRNELMLDVADFLIKKERNRIKKANKAIVVHGGTSGE